MTDLAAISRRALFDVFPDNPGDPEANGVRNLRASLQSVLTNKQANRMAPQRYDIRRHDGSWERRHWQPVNFPILDDHGEIDFIVHNVEDVTSLSQNPLWRFPSHWNEGWLSGIVRRIVGRVLQAPAAERPIALPLTRHRSDPCGPPNGLFHHCRMRITRVCNRSCQPSP